MYEGITPSPDSGFVRKLKTFDPALKVEFDRQCGKFVITQPRRGGAGRAHALVVEPLPDDDRPWRQPNELDLKLLASGDFERRSHRERIRAGEEYMLEYEAAQDRKIAQEFRENSRDNKLQLQRTYRKAMNDGKTSSPFRPVEVKSKGYKVVDRRKLSQPATV